MNTTMMPRTSITPSSTKYMMSSLVNWNMPRKPFGVSAGIPEGTSAKRRFTISTWSPRFWSKPMAERTRVAIRSRSSFERAA
jgi:hypothetical protein